MKGNIVTTSMYLLLVPILHAVTFVDWTGATPGPSGIVVGSVTGPSGARSQVTFAGEVDARTIVNNSYSGVFGAQGWAESFYTPKITSPSDIIVTQSATNPAVVSFCPPVVDPVFHIFSLGNSGAGITQSWTFSSPFTILSTGSEFGGSGLSNPSGNILRSREGSGTIKFSGTFSQISWNSSGVEDYQGIHVGIGDVSERHILENSVTYGLSGAHTVVASFTPANGMTLDEAAAALGVSHFNWLQTFLPPDHWNVALIQSNQILPAPTSPAVLPCIDPSPDPNIRYIVTVIPGIPVYSQWRIETDQPLDDKIFYWNEIGELDNYIVNNRHTLLFRDTPKFPNAFFFPLSHVKFTTRLVGVRADGSYRFFGFKTGFSWRSDAVFDASAATSGGVFGMFPLKNPRTYPTNAKG